MANTEIKKLVQIDTGNSTQTVKGLKKEISDLKDLILNLENGTEEYNDAVKNLTDRQRKLDEVMSLTKKTATALEGSYDSLVHQMSLLKKEWRATNDEARRNELGKQIDELNSQLKELDAQTGNFQRNVGNYVSHWEGMPEVTKDFATSMRELNERIEPTKQGLESMQKIAAGITSGFAAVQGIMALTGAESENFEKTLIKVQAAMAVAQGVGGLKDLVEGLGKANVAFATLGKTVKMVSATLGKTGWLAVLTVVVSTIALVTSKIKNKREEVDRLDASLSKLENRNSNLIESDNERARQLEREIKVMSANGATEKEILEKRLEHNQLYVDASKRIYDEAQKQYLGLKDSLAMGIKGVTQEDVDRAKEIYDTANANYKEYSEKRKDILNDMVVADIKAKEKLKENAPLSKEDALALARKQRDEATEEDLSKVVDVDIKTEDISLEDVKGKSKQRAEILIGYAESAAKRLKEINYMSVEDERTKAAKDYEINLNLLTEKLRLLEKYYQDAVTNGDTDSLIALEQQIADTEIEIERTKYDEMKRLRELDAEDRKKKKEEEDAAEQERLEKKKENTDKAISITQAGIGTTADILYSLTEIYGKDEESQKKNAKKIKGLRIATATMDTLQGAVAAFTSAQQLGPIAGPIVGGINAAAVAAMGWANIAKIKATDYDGSTTNASVTPATSTYTNELPVQFTRSVTSNSEIEKLNQDQRVYVLESDISDAVNRQKVRVTESTF